MKLVKVTQWRVPYPGYLLEIDLFLDGCYGHFGDDEDYEGNHPERVYEIADGEKVPLNAHYEAYWKNGQLAQKGTYIDGLRQGFWQHYSENGNISERCFLINYRLGATAYLYDENGQLEKTIGVK